MISSISTQWRLVILIYEGDAEEVDYLIIY